jgi:hypothetical protein
MTLAARVGIACVLLCGVVLRAQQVVELAPAPTPLADVNASPGDTGVLVAAFTLRRTLNTSTTFTELTVPMGGTAGSAAISELRLFEQLDRYGVFPGSQLRATAVPAGGLVHFTGIGGPVSHTTDLIARTYFLVADVAPNAPLSADFEVTLDAANVLVSTGSVVGNPFRGAAVAISNAGNPRLQLERDGQTYSMNDQDFLGDVSASGVELRYDLANYGMGVLVLAGPPGVEVTEESGCAVTILEEPLAPLPGGTNGPLRLEVVPQVGQMFSFRVRIFSNDPSVQAYRFIFAVLGFEETAPAPHLKILRQPGNPSCAAGFLDPQPRVVVWDSLGNRIYNYEEPVTVSVESGPPGAAMLGSTTLRAQFGAVEFFNLKASAPGTYRIRVTAPLMRADVSQTFVVPSTPCLRLDGERRCAAAPGPLDWGGHALAAGLVALVLFRRRLWRRQV